MALLQTDIVHIGYLQLSTIRRADEPGNLNHGICRKDTGRARQNWILAAQVSPQCSAPALVIKIDHSVTISCPLTLHP
jgi:hypothetical protein